MKRIPLLTIAVLLLAVTSLAQAEPGRKYLQFNRNPVDPDGVQQSELKDGQVIVPLPYDTWITMQGASGEWVSGWAPEGKLMVARPVSTQSAVGTIYSYRGEAVQSCGNPTPKFYFPAPAPPCKPKIQYVPGPERPTYWEVNERTTVEETEFVLVYTSQEEKPLQNPGSKYETHWVEGWGKTIVRGALGVAAMAARKPDRVMMVQQQSTAVANDNDLTAIQDTTNIIKTQVGVQTGVVVDNN